MWFLNCERGKSNGAVSRWKIKKVHDPKTKKKKTRLSLDGNQTQT